MKFLKNLFQNRKIATCCGVDCCKDGNCACRDCNCGPECCKPADAKASATSCCN
jgi:hypothetical protein